MDSSIFINRETSWLDFNSRVLDQAFDMGNPLLERIKFVAIFSNNLDEFFMVRVAGLKQQLESGNPSWDPAGMSNEEQLRAIRLRTLALMRSQYALLRERLLPELRANGIFLLRMDELPQAEADRMAIFFERDVMPMLTPEAVDPSHPFPVINNRVLCVAASLRRPPEAVLFPGRSFNAFVEVPPTRARFIEVAPPAGAPPGARAFVLLEDLILRHLDKLFAGCEIREAFLFRITKDMDFSIDEEHASDILSHIKRELISSRKREAIRLEILEDTRGELLGWLVESLNIERDEIYRVPGPLALSSFFELVSKAARPDLCDVRMPPLDIPAFADKKTIFDTIRREGSIPLYLPFESFQPVVNFLEAAADDPGVLAIKQTLYRVSGESPVVKALLRAAENKKQVTAIVELKARFDEERNIEWARRLEESGAHVTYGLAGLKIHGKALLVVRREADGIRRYAHLSTGNYNDATARVYTDIGLFTADPDLCADVAALFNVMTGYSEPPRWNKISAAPFDLRKTFVRLIDREARLSTPHAPGRIIAKMNSLVDPEIVERLHHAAQAGVRVDLIVRGICCLRIPPGGGNIRVVSIVDRFLEHTRIYYFQNGGDPEYYLSSADWMPRNLDRRIELLFPVEDPRIRATLAEMLDIQLNDRRKGRRLNAKGVYSRCDPAAEETRSQTLTYKRLAARHAAAAEDAPSRRKYKVMRKPG